MGNERTRTERQECILYVSSNDGSDTRIVKEIKTLSGKYEVIFFGIGEENNSFLNEYCSHSYIIRGGRKNPLTIFRQFIRVVHTLREYPNASLHIVNEQHLIFYYPLLRQRHVVLDIFDSIFLTYNRPNEQALWLKKMIYQHADRIIVTDRNRRTLLPAFARPKTIIVPNFPFLQRFEVKNHRARRGSELVILFFGWLGKNRGGDHVRKLLKASPRVRIIAIGWIGDEETKHILDDPRVDYRGVVSQEQALQVAYRECDYILCVYKPETINNIYASPNKINDSIHTGVPVIMNSEILAAEEVRKLNIGAILKSYDEEIDAGVVDHLIDRIGSFEFNDELARTHSWETIETTLLEAHER